MTDDVDALVDEGAKIAKEAFPNDPFEQGYSTPAGVEGETQSRIVELEARIDHLEGLVPKFNDTVWRLRSLQKAVRELLSDKTLYLPHTLRERLDVLSEPENGSEEESE